MLRSFQSGSPGECQVRTAMSGDGARAYLNDEGILAAIDTTTNQIFYPPGVPQGDDELALSSNQTSLAGAEYLLDTDLGVQAYLAENEREADVLAVYGEKISPDGSLLFSPLASGIDLLDARTGVWRGRVGLPIGLASNYDALVADGTSNLLLAITGKGDGIAIVDLRPVAIPAPLPYVRTRKAPGIIQGAWLALPDTGRVAPPRFRAGHPGLHRSRSPESAASLSRTP